MQRQNVTKNITPLQQLMKRTLFVIGCTVTTTMLASCVTSSHVTDTYCLLYKTVYSSRLDTEETKAQIDQNNAVWMERCDER